MTSRLKYIDIAKFIAILAIIDVHIQSGPNLELGETFHVSTFLLLPGLLFSKEDKLNCPIGQFVCKKAQRLLWPYLTFSLLNVLLLLFIGYFKGHYEGAQKAVISTVLFKGYGTLWFLPALFGGEIITDAIFRLCKGKRSLLFLFLLLIVLIICGEQKFYLNKEFLSVNFVTLNCSLIRWPLIFINISLVCSSFLILGYVISLIIKTKEEPSNKNIAILIALSIVCILVDYFIHSQYECDLHKMNVSPLYIYYGCSICGAIFVVAISLLISYLPWRIDGIVYFGRNSLTVMTTHKELFICYLPYMMLSHIPLLAATPRLVSFLTIISTVLIEMLIIKLINGSKLKCIIKYPFAQ